MEITLIAYVNFGDDYGCNYYHAYIASVGDSGKFVAFTQHPREDVAESTPAYWSLASLTEETSQAEWIYISYERPEIISVVCDEANANAFVLPDELRAFKGAQSTELLDKAEVIRLNETSTLAYIKATKVYVPRCVSDTAVTLTSEWAFTYNILKRYNICEYGQSWGIYATEPKDDKPFPVPSNLRRKTTFDRSETVEPASESDAENEELMTIEVYNDTLQKWEVVKENKNPFIEKINALTEKYFDVIEWVPLKQSRSGKTIYMSTSANADRLPQLGESHVWNYAGGNTDRIFLLEAIKKGSLADNDICDFVNTFARYYSYHWGFCFRKSVAETKDYFEMFSQSGKLLETTAYPKLPVGKRVRRGLTPEEEAEAKPRLEQNKRDCEEIARTFAQYCEARRRGDELAAFDIAAGEASKLFKC